MIQERYLCVCGKYITLTKAGNFRYHNGTKPLGPGSRFTAVCAGVGKKP